MWHGIVSISVCNVAEFLSFQICNHFSLQSSTAHLDGQPQVKLIPPASCYIISQFQTNESWHFYLKICLWHHRNACLLMDKSAN